MWFKVVYFFAAIIIGIGIFMLATDNIATPTLNTGTGSIVITFNGAQIIFLGGLILLITYLGQKRIERNSDRKRHC